MAAVRFKEGEPDTANMSREDLERMAESAELMSRTAFRKDDARYWAETAKAFRVGAKGTEDGR